MFLCGNFALKALHIGEIMSNNEIMQFSYFYDYVFHIGNEMIDIVKDYTYLGTRISSPGNFTLSLEHLRQKALHALFSLRRHTDFSKLKPSLANKIFDTMISPILKNLTHPVCIARSRSTYALHS